MTSKLSNILDSIGKGDLAEVYDDIGALEMTYDVQMRLVDSFNRRVKKLTSTGSSLSRAERDVAKKLLTDLTDHQVSCIGSSALPYLHQVSSIYRHMLIKEKCLLLDVGEKLLLLDEKSVCAGYDPQTRTSLRNNLYAYSWNFLRENHQDLEPENSLLVVSQALRWLIRQGEKTFSNASHKLQQMTHIFISCSTYSPVKAFIATLCNEAKRVWLLDLKPGAWKQDALQLDGLINFTLLSIRCAISFQKYDLAKHTSNEILSVFGQYFEPELTTIVEKVAKLFYLLVFSMSKLEKSATRDEENGNENTETDFMTLTVQLTKLLEQSKAPGVRLAVSYGFLHGICSHIQSLMKTSSPWVYSECPKEFERFVSALFKLIHTMRSSPSHSDISHIDKKRRDLESLSYLLLLRMVSDFMNSCRKSSFAMVMIVEKCFEGLNRLCVTEQKPKEAVMEIYTKMNYHGGQIGSNLVKMKDFNTAIKVLQLSIEVAEKLHDLEDVECKKVDPTHLCMHIADAYNQMKEYDTGLRFLAEMVWKYPVLMDSSNHTSCVDVLEPISWYNWNYHWISMKRNAAANNCKDMMCKGVADYLLANKKYREALMENNKDRLIRILHFEFNSYFASKSVIPDGLINVGENLHRYGNTTLHQALGNLAQGVGFWWGDVAQITDSIELCQEALNMLEKESEITRGDPSLHLFVAIVHIWLSLGYLRKFQDKAVVELETLKNDDVAQNPRKYSNDDDRASSRVIPAISSINLEDETLVATNLSKAIDILFDMCSLQDANETDLRKWIEKSGSGVVLVSLRLMTDISNALGNKYSYFKCLCVTRTVAEMYNRTYFSMLVITELIKACPSVAPQLLVPMAKFKEIVESRKNLVYLKNSSLYFMRLTLARAVAHIHCKEYQEAISALSEIFKYRVAQDIFDVGLLVLGEAYFVLAELKLLEIDISLDLSSIPKYVKYLTPVGLVSKGFKILANVSRTPNPTESGWNDLFHNNNILATIMDVSDTAIKVYYLCGKLREARCIAADFIYLAQQMALVSRTINLVIPLAEMDIISRSFDSCQLKMECLLSMMKGHIPNKGNTSQIPVSLLERLNLSTKDFQRIYDDDNDFWHVTYVSLPEHNYGPFGPPPAYLSQSPIINEPLKMRRFSYLNHSIGCVCYICSHSKIIPSVLRFYCLQARLASCSQNMPESGKILEEANRQHLRAMLRIMNNFEVMKKNFSFYFPVSSSPEILGLIYKDFFTEPGLYSQLTKMEIMPAMDLKESIPSFAQVLAGLKLMDCFHSAYTSIPLEMLSAAVFQSVFLQPDSKIKRTNLREIIKIKSAAEETNYGGVSPQKMHTPPMRGVKPPQRKGLGKKYVVDDSSDDEFQDATEDFGTSSKLKPGKFKFDESEDMFPASMSSTSSNATGELVSGPARNTRSRMNSTDKV